MREPPEGFSIVSAVEFAMLCHLPEFERRGSGLVRVDDPEKFVIEQSEWDRHKQICTRVEVECDALNASISTDQAQAEMQRLLAIEPKPKVEPIPKVETIEPPTHPKNGNRRPSWYREPFDPYGGR